MPGVVIALVPEYSKFGHKCNYDNRIPDDSKLAKISPPKAKRHRDINHVIKSSSILHYV